MSNNSSPASIARAVHYVADTGELIVDAVLAGNDGWNSVRDMSGVAALIAQLPSTDALACLGLYSLLLAWRDGSYAALAGALQAFQTVRASATQAQRCLEGAIAQITGQPDAQVPTVLEALARAEAERADRAAERCGRRAADLLDASDLIAAHQSCGPALEWMLLDANIARDRVIQLVNAEFDTPDSQHVALFLFGAESVALDGSALLSADAAEKLSKAQALALPRYLMIPNGPDTAIATHTAPLAPEVRLAPAHDISAIITDRGLYRPEMVARYVNDAGLPFGVIPLS